MIFYLTEYLDCVLEYTSRNLHPAWKGKNRTVLDLQAAPQKVQQFVRVNAIKPAGKPLVLPNKNHGTATDYSIDNSRALTVASTAPASSHPAWKTRVRGQSGFTLLCGAFYARWATQFTIVSIVART